jgi:hypothetical protein
LPSGLAYAICLRSINRIHIVFKAVTSWGYMMGHVYGLGWRFTSSTICRVL